MLTMAASPAAGRPPRRSLSDLALRFRREREGVSAVEFALVLPIMLTIWAGVSEFAHAADYWRKLTLLSRTVSDLTAQGDVVTVSAGKSNPEISANLMKDILGAATSQVRPFDASTVKIVVSAMMVPAPGAGVKPQVCSSTANANAVGRSVGVASDLTVPAGFQTQGMRYVLDEVSMTYSPMLGSSFAKLFSSAGTIVLRSSMPWPTRGGATVNSPLFKEVILPGGKACPII